MWKIDASKIARVNYHVNIIKLDLDKTVESRGGTGGQERIMALVSMRVISINLTIFLKSQCKSF